MLAGWLCTVQSSCPECYCSALLTRGTKEKPSGETTLLFPKNFNMRKMTEKEDLMKEFELLQEGSKHFFNEIGYKKRSHVIMVLEI